MSNFKDLGIMRIPKKKPLRHEKHDHWHEAYVSLDENPKMKRRHGGLIRTMC